MGLVDDGHVECALMVVGQRLRGDETGGSSA